MAFHSKTPTIGASLGDATTLAALRADHLDGATFTAMLTRLAARSAVAERTPGNDDRKAGAASAGND